MSDRTYPTAAEARKAALAAAVRFGGHQARCDVLSACVTCTTLEAAMLRAAERAQQAAVREALAVCVCRRSPDVRRFECRAHSVLREPLWCERCILLRDAERALDALEEAR